jgi:Zn-dependent M32 family carboxypeptidase
MKKVFSEPKVPYFDAFTTKILDAMDVHYQKLVEKTIAENSYLVVTNEKDEIVRVYADELKRQLDAGLLD